MSLWDLGLIYNIDIDKKLGRVEILMTLTTVGCPLYEQIAGSIRQEVGKLKSVKKVDVVLTFKPPWTAERMSKKVNIVLISLALLSKKAKAQLGF